LSHSFLAKQDDPVGIRTGRVVLDAPDVGGLGEFLEVDDNSLTSETP
jgi:hypothetical protein